MHYPKALFEGTQTSCINHIGRRHKRPKLSLTLFVAALVGWLGGKLSNSFQTKTLKSQDKTELGSRTNTDTIEERNTKIQIQIQL